MLRSALCLMPVLGCLGLFSSPLQSTAQERLDAVGDPLPESALLRLGSLRFSSPDGVMELLLSRDNQTLVSFGPIIIGWDVPTGKELWRQQSPLGYLPACYGNRAVTIAADGAHFLMADHASGFVTQWDMRTGRSEETSIPCTAGPVGRTGAACAIDLSLGGQYMFLGNGNGYRVLDSQGQVLYEQQKSMPPVERDRDRLTFGGGYTYGRFSPDGSQLALVTSQNPKKIRLLDSRTGDVQGTIDCTDNIVRLAFTPNGHQLAATERDTSVRLYDRKSLKLVWETVFEVDKRSENYTSALAFSPDGKRLLVCERNETIFQVDATTGEEIGAIQNHSWNPWALAFDSQGNTLFSSGWGGTIHQWNADTLESLPLPKGFRGTDSVTLSKDGQLAAHVDQSGAIHVVNLSNGESNSVLRLPGASFEVLEFSWDSSTLVAGGSWNTEVHIIEWDLGSSQVRYEWKWDVGNDPVTGVEDIVFSPDDERVLATIFRQSSAHLLDRESRQRKELPHRRVYGSSFSPDGEKIYTAGWDRMLREWDGSTGELLRETPVESSMRDKRMYSVAADPSGKYLATCTLNESIGIYDSESHALLQEWDVVASFVFGALRFSPDGLWLASGNASGQVIVWDPESGNRLHTIEAHDNHVYTIDFGADNRTICSGGSNIGYIWDLRPKQLRCDNFDKALELLRGHDPVAAYDAWWYLVEQGDDSVPHIQALCSGISKIVDITALVRKSSDSQRERRRELLQLATSGDSESISLASVKRLVSVLSHIGSEESLEALNALSERDDLLGMQARWESVRRARN